MFYSINSGQYGMIARHGAEENDEIQTSLQRLSSGLRINNSADDMASLAISDQLEVERQTSIQALKNTNDAIGIMQIADNAINEQSEILNTIAAKMVQAASDAQTTDTRKAIKKEVQALMKSYHSISEQTSYNGMGLLNGGFSNKTFGNGTNVNLNISSTTKLGHHSFLESSGEVKEFNDYFGNTKLILKDKHNQDIEFNQYIGYEKGEGLGGLVEQINAKTKDTGISAKYDVDYTFQDGTKEVKAIEVVDISGESEEQLRKRKEALYMLDIDYQIQLNGVNITSNIGKIKDKDSDYFLRETINGLTDKTGVTASLNESDALVLESVDRRAIRLKESVADKDVTGDSDYVTLKELEDYTSLNDLEKMPLEMNIQAIWNKLKVMQIAGNVNVESPLVENYGTASKKINYNEELERFELPKSNMDSKAYPIITNLPPSEKVEFGMNNFGLANNEFFRVYKSVDYANVLQELVDDGVVTTTSGNLTNPEWKAVSDKLKEKHDDGDIKMVFGAIGTGYGATDYPNVTIDSTYIKNYNVNSLQNANDGTGFIEFNNTGETLYMEGLGAALKLNYLNVEVKRDMPASIGTIKLTSENNTDLNIRGTGLAYAGLDEFTKSKKDLSDIFDFSSIESIQESLSIVQISAKYLNKIRSDIGSTQNQFESLSNVLITRQVNLAKANSELVDLDFASEMTNFEKSKALQQANAFSLNKLLKLNETLILDAVSQGLK